MILIIPEKNEGKLYWLKWQGFPGLIFASFTEGLFMPVILDLDSGHMDLYPGGIYLLYLEHEMLRWGKQEGEIDEQWVGMGKITNIPISLLEKKKKGK